MGKILKGVLNIAAAPIKLIVGTGKVAKTGYTLAKNGIANAKDNLRNAEYKSNIKRLITKWKAEIIEIVKKLQKDLIKDAEKRGSKEIRKNNRLRVQHKLTNPMDRVGKESAEKRVLKNMNKALPTKAASKAIISGNKGAMTKGLNGPTR